MLTISRGFFLSTMYCGFCKAFDKATSKVLLGDLVKSEPGDFTVACLSGGLSNHSFLVRS